MGEHLGRYAVLRRLASGGMADVMLARSDGIEGFERHVVLKRIKAEHARDPRFVSMFLDEARLAATLHHQHIVQVFDIGEADGEYFFAMEYVHGEDVRRMLSHVVRGKTHLPLAHSLAIVSAAASALHYAHERRGNDKKPLHIVHRDVSPSNILVGYDGGIKLVDFGIAKAASRTKEGKTGAQKGKVAYMSPEQVKGDAIDRRSDVWSLGVVLYELATTTRLFKGDSDYVVMDQVVGGKIPLPRIRRPELPNEVSTLIMGALAVDPARRYQTADDLRVAVDAYAVKAGLAPSTAALSAYMKKLFGERPEPWLDSSKTIPISGGSWTDAPTTGSVPVTRTSGRFGYEQQAVKPTMPRTRFAGAKVVAVALAVLAIAGVAAWRLAKQGDDEPAAQPSRLSAAAVDAVAAAHADQLAACTPHGAHGELAIRFDVDAAGKVVHAEPTATAGDDALAACVARAVQTWQFPATGAAQGVYSRSY